MTAAAFLNSTFDAFDALTNIIMETAQDVAQSSGGVGSMRVPGSLLHVKSPSAKAQTYNCNGCSTTLASSSDLVSKKFNGSHGKAYLFAKVTNVDEGKAKGSCLTSGYHEICDITCSRCSVVLGWKYIQASEASQRYKEGKYILERNLITAVDEKPGKSNSPTKTAVAPGTTTIPSHQLLSGQFALSAGICIIQVDDPSEPKSFSIVLDGTDSPSLPTVEKSKGASFAEAAVQASIPDSLLSDEEFAITIRADSNAPKQVELVHWFVAIGDKAMIAPMLTERRKLFTSADAMAALSDKDQAILGDALQLIQTRHTADSNALSDIISATSKLNVASDSQTTTKDPMSKSILLDGEADWNVVNEIDEDFEAV